MRNLDIDELSVRNLWGQKDVYRINVLDLRDGTPLGIPLAVVMGEEGPIHCLVSAQHGDEWNGAYLCNLLFHELEVDKLKGGVVMVPLANPLAFNEKARVASIDNIDMNRVYTFVKRRKPTEQTAYLVFQSIVSNCDFLLDLHTGGPGAYLPHVEVLSEERVRLASSLNLDFVGIVRKNQGALVPAGERLGIPSFSIEMGQARRISEDFVGRVKEGFLNFLRATGTLAGQPVQAQGRRVFSKKVLIPAEAAGFFTAAAALGDKVQAGDLLGHITPLFTGQSVAVTVPHAGFVIYLRVEEVIGEGESLAHVALLE